MRYGASARRSERTMHQRDAVLEPESTVYVRSVSALTVLHGGDRYGVRLQSKRFFACRRAPRAKRNRGRTPSGKRYRPFRACATFARQDPDTRRVRRDAPRLSLIIIVKREATLGRPSRPHGSLGATRTCLSTNQRRNECRRQTGQDVPLSGKVHHSKVDLPQTLRTRGRRTLPSKTQRAARHRRVRRLAR